MFTEKDIKDVMNFISVIYLYIFKVILPVKLILEGRLCTGKYQFEAGRKGGKKVLRDKNVYRVLK